jgi:hypothetical protein
LIAQNAGCRIGSSALGSAKVGCLLLRLAHEIRSDPRETPAKFLVKTRRVRRVPLESIRWFGDQTFAALVASTETGQHWLWRPVKLGISDTTFAEVVSGLEPGDRVIAHTGNLPPDGGGLLHPDIVMDLALEHE